VSFWLDDLADDPLVPRPGLPGDLDVDVAIVGAGYTGLWTAYHLVRADPSLRIAVLEAEIAGFGASGRNGGGCSAILPMEMATLARGPGGRDGALAMQRVMRSAVAEVGAAAAAEGIECGFAHGGHLCAATDPARLTRLRTGVDDARQWDTSPDDLRLLSADEASQRLRVAGVVGATYTPHCAALQPAALARGLARVVERAGVDLFEQTRVTDIAPGRVRCEAGLVRAEIVVRATEAYTHALASSRRQLAPLYSLMIATEPLPQDLWDQLGWADRETLDDARHLIVYAQRTADGRIAFGGRGAPYHFGSRIDADFDRDPRVHHALQRALVGLFPQLAEARITHAWGGPLGVPRDWHASVGLDRATGLAWAGGYVGDGVCTSFVAGRTLADLVTGARTELVGLPWVGHRSRRWEPEPLRWLGISAGLALPAYADRREARTGRPARWTSRLIDRFRGG
jgi:glycine/D-amino acid oxidase-like deaminating enzyme